MPKKHTKKHTKKSRKFGSFWKKSSPKQIKHISIGSPSLDKDDWRKIMNAYSYDLKSTGKSTKDRADRDDHRSAVREAFLANRIWKMNR